MQKEFKLKVSGVATFNGTVTVLAENVEEATANKYQEGISLDEVAGLKLTRLLSWEADEAEKVAPLTGIDTCEFEEWERI